MVDDLKKCYHKTNLLKAWNWIQTNSDFRYKNYFRDLYTAYNLCIEENLKDLSERLKNDYFEPSKPSKLYVPKSEFLMRPFTLLPIEDQIVYQAFVNIIALYHYKVAKKRYYKNVFGHIYSGKKYFYKNWVGGYNRYIESIKSAYLEGYTYIAFFDLTSCYDSIDHNIIEYFLLNYGIEKEFIDKLKSFLSRWSTNKELYQSHGIPQGPSASGLLSEVILSYLDKNCLKQKNIDVKYFRYVDDIRILGKDRVSLKKMLVVLDYYSKQIGLFPQSSKIDIHEIKDIKSEIKDIKNLSNILFPKAKDTPKINDRLLKLLRKKVLENKTEFKVYLSRAEPNAKLTLKLLDLLENHPDLIDNIMLYLSSYSKNISNKAVDKIISYLTQPEVFQVVNAVLIESIGGKLSQLNKDKIIKFIRERWEEREENPLNPKYRYVILSLLLNNDELKYNEIKSIFDNEKDWWVKKSLIKYINIELIGEPSFIEIMKKLLFDQSIDIAICAAQEIIKHNCKLNPPYNRINHIAQKQLKFARIISRAGSRPSKIGECLERICNKKIPDIRWKIVFREQHDIAENRIIIALSYSRTDISAFINIIDTFNDLLLNRLYSRDKSLGTYQLGNMGSVLNSSRLQTKYPRLFNYCKEIHDKRLECYLSHPITKATKKYTKKIEYKYIYRVRHLLYEGILEFINNW